MRDKIRGVAKNNASAKLVDLVRRSRLLARITGLHIRVGFAAWYNIARRTIYSRMPIDVQRLILCLFETEQELIRIGRERHEFLQEQSQPAALILLLLRSCSLFRGMLTSFERQELDAFDAVRRAYLESWHLAFQFRMPAVGGQPGRWLEGQGNSWSADIRALERYARGRGLLAPDLGSDYGELSELAHPTRSAAENSAAVILWKRGINEYGETVEAAILGLERGMSAMLYRLLWLALDEDATLIPLQLDANRMPTAVAFCAEFQAALR
jgi:hypothetical protein